MPLTACNRRAFLGLASGTALAGIAILTSGRAEASFEVQHSEAVWRQKLGSARFQVLREAATERPFTSPLLKEKRKGVYACAGCDLPVFSSAAKYDSGTGWPSFTRTLAKAVAYKRDRTLGMDRTEEHCRRCGGHLGHVFDDGPPPTRKRHCINGLSLTFKPA
ncbi:peptide-methionine (R)-S-oxide reductase MsrB [Sphingomonas sp. NSE70-1]|uniref:peptide-methionine (R)-S-oxide reductase n=1 Tax=Sphingomonas caseinilyticus TaxID=2908205 RepID=A0ABT0RQC4_9SPHN|nr:peptide-methionine (R)-S-oxide reductase MsrB [Sphingomonas caseinilyticus]MCL6697217.1 peptide-methionine (R)-S-oxide reductase MsrB [Sphingomonas caseinilyticus]